MKKTIVLFCMLALLSATSYAQDDFPSAKKYYCCADQVEVSDSMILIHLDDTIYELDSLLVDQGGVYFMENMLRCTYCRRPVNPKRICDCNQ